MELDATVRLRREEGLEAARIAVRTNIGKRHMDSMRALGERMMSRERELLATRQAAAQRTALHTASQIIVSNAAGTVAIIAFLLLLRRHIASRERAMAEIAMQREQLQAADRRKDEFLATLAHELRNPLAPMSNALFIIGEPGAPQSSRDRAVSTLQRQVRQMVKLIDDLLDVGRIRLGKLTLAPRLVKLAEVVDQAVETVAPLVEGSRHRLRVELPAEPVWLEADPIRLAQLVSNLLNNAAKFTPAGGELSLAASVEPGWVVLRVKDNGPGMDPARLEEIFDLFTQLDHVLERRHAGLGIGLALVRRIAEMHGGTVVARSEGAGRGSEFIVRLPTASAPAVAITAHAAEPIGNRARRVLVVDDNRDGVETLAAMVQMIGHEARACHDAPSALQVGAEWKPDLVIMDIGMPGMNGYDACKALRMTPWGREAVVVALTGWGQESDRRLAEEAGFDHHVVKPIGEDRLRTLCRDAGADAPAPASAAA
jgi:signal transduction histidine kinase/ActR/RegA family two-component response regulator